MVGGIFITVQDVQQLMGCNRYNTAQQYLLTVKDAMKLKRKYITIKEFCAYEELEFEYVWKIIRPGIPITI
ncbi:MAG: hypothetical protein JNJ41_11330 [Bacteroidia bacterium]|nr:hypothetical protein [Bacteroidia bacterium]